MNHESIQTNMMANASVVMRPDFMEAFPFPRFIAAIECVGEFGDLRWSDEIKNLVTTQGKNHILDTYFNGAAFTATWFVGLIDNAGSPTVLAADTYASHTFTELVGYSNANRLALGLGAAAAGSAVTGTIGFSINAPNTVNGCFICNNNTKNDTAGAGGRLYSGGTFAAGARAVLSGDTLNMIITLSAA